MKKLLIIGGTRFVGRNLLEKLIHNHPHYSVTLFNRGITNPHLFPEINKIFGDRKNIEDISKIATTFWDCIIDISGYWPDALEQQLNIHKGNFDKYIYISTCSHYVFHPNHPHLIHEDEPTVTCTEEEKHSEGLQYYNQKKAECERILLETIDNLIILRPGLIIGKYDSTDRLYYWLHKVFSQEKILLAEACKNAISFTYVADLVNIITYFIENTGKHKIYNASSYKAAIEDFVQMSITTLDKQPALIYATHSFLEEHQVEEWVDLPLCLNGTYLTVNSMRLWNELPFRPSSLEQSFAQMIDFYTQERCWETPNVTPPAMTADREKQLLEKF